VGRKPVLASLKPDDTKPDDPPSADIEQTLPWKCKMSRGQITKGEKSVKMKTAAAQQQLRPVDEVQDVEENLTFMNETPVVSMNPSNTTHLRGFLWISRSPVLDKAKCIKFTLAQVEKNMKQSLKIFSDICTKFVPKCQSIFFRSGHGQLAKVAGGSKEAVGSCIIFKYSGWL